MKTTRIMLTVVMLMAAIVLVAGAAPASASTVTLQAGVGGQPSEIIQEAMTVQQNVNDNFGGRGNIEVGVLNNGGVRTTVMRFDVADSSVGLYIAGVPQFQSIDGITLTLTTAGNSHNSQNMSLRVAAGTESQGDWVEGTGTSASNPNTGSEADIGQITYSERREGQSTPWQPNTNYHRGAGDGELGRLTTWPGTNTAFDIDLSPLAGESLSDLVTRWVTGNNEGVLLNDINRSGFARWFMHSSESPTLSARPMLTIEYTPIPEPATMCALGLAVAGLGGYVRKRKRG